MVRAWLSDRLDLISFQPNSLRLCTASKSNAAAAVLFARTGVQMDFEVAAIIDSVKLLLANLIANGRCKSRERRLRGVEAKMTDEVAIGLRAN